MKFLIIGKHSYLAQHLGNGLVKAGYDSPVWITHAAYDNMEADTAAFKDLDNLPCRFDAVINCAVSYGRKQETYAEMLEINTLYPLKILEWASRNNVKYFINTATSINSLINPYTLSKSQFSEWGRLHAENNPIKFINIILEHYMGAGAPESNFISMLLRKMSSNIEYINLTQGMQLRDFIYIDDVVSGYMTVIKHLEEIHSPYCEIHLGSGIPYRIKEICEYIKKVLNSKTQLNFGAVPYRSHEIMYSCADNTQLRKWGWDNSFSFEDAVQIIIKKENLR